MALLRTDSVGEVVCKRDRGLAYLPWSAAPTHDAQICGSAKLRLAVRIVAKKCIKVLCFRLQAAKAVLEDTEVPHPLLLDLKLVTWQMNYPGTFNI